MKTSEKIDQIMAALCSARKKFKTVELDKQGQRNKYASLESMLKATQEALFDHDINYIFSLVDDHRSIECRLIHSASEQYIAATWPLFGSANKAMNEDQAFGSSSSYAKRYCYGSLLGLKGEEVDPDDVEHEAQEDVAYKVKEPEACIDKTQVDFLLSELKSAKNGAELLDKIMGFNKIKSIAVLPASKFEVVKSYIMKNKDKE